VEEVDSEQGRLV